jgi:hypothetical protein
MRKLADEILNLQFRRNQPPPRCRARVLLLMGLSSLAMDTFAVAADAEGGTPVNRIVSGS